MNINLAFTFNFIGYALIQIPDFLISFYDNHQEKLTNRNFPKSRHNKNNDRALPINRVNRNGSITANELVKNTNSTSPKELDDVRKHIVEIFKQLRLLNKRVDEIQK